MTTYTNRKEIPEQYKWALEKTYATSQVWEKVYEETMGKIVKFAEFQGTLNNAESILTAFKAKSLILEEFDRLYAFAFMRYCQDTKDTEFQNMFSKAGSMMTKLMDALSFVDPELSRLPESIIDQMMADPKFSDYDRDLRKLKLSKKHILTENEEKIVAMSTDFSKYFNEIFTRLNNGDLEFGSIMVDGKEVKLTHGSYSTLLNNPDQNVRRQAFERFYKPYIDINNTLAAVYEGSVKKDIFTAKVRNFNSAMEMFMFENDEYPEVYQTLIKSIHSNFEPLHEYIALRKKLLGVEKLNMYDMYVPIFDNADISVDFEEAFKIVLKGLEPLGEDYQELLKKAKAERWMDVYETPTKRSGAFSYGVYGAQPFVLLNYQQTTDSIFTTAHELGHSMHSFYSCKEQPFEKAGYKIFVAEVASTCNEILLINYLLKTEKDINIRKFLLSFYLDTLRGTMYRQTMFAEFEAMAHEKAEAGIPLTAELLNNEYLKLNKMYYGDAIEHNKEISYEWSRIPHFYRPFYVYKYATGIISAVCIANKILEQGAPMVEKYKKFLSLGCSMDPVEELKVADVDLTTSEPFDIVAKTFRDTLNELKELCK